MSSRPHNLISCLRTMVVGAWRNDPRSDAELINKYVETKDEMAFAAIMWRHGTLVWRTCRHVLGDTSDAEDAFQLTFLALSSQAGRLRREPLAGWLYRVARRAALNTRIGVKRRLNLEQKLRAEAKSETEDEKSVNRSKLYMELEEELASLPEKLRVPLLMHFFEGKSQVEVAQIIGCARNVLRRRLAKAEGILRERLEKRGLTLGAMSVAAVLGNGIGISTVPARIIESTARAAVAFEAGTLTGEVAEGAEKLLHSLAMKGIVKKFWFVMLICAGSLGIGGAGWVAWKMLGVGYDIAKPAVPALPAEPAKVRDERVDIYSDPLPEGAVARIGTIRFRPGVAGGRSQGKTAFLLDGKTLISIHGGNTVHFWETLTGKELRRLEGPANCQSMAVSPDGKKLAIVGEKEIEVWDLNDTPPRVCFLKRHQSRWGTNQLVVVFTPDSKAMAISVAGEADIWLLDAANGDLRLTLKEGKPVERGKVLAFSPDGRTLATENGLWEAAIGKKQHDLVLKQKHTLESLLFSLDGKMLATVETVGSSDQANYVLCLRNATTGAERCQVADDVKRSFVTFLPDRQTLLEVRYNEPMRFWDLTTGRAKVSTVTFPESSRLSETTRTEMCLSSDGKFLAEASHQAVGIWDVATGREIGPVKAIRKRIQAMAFAPDGKRLATLTDWTELRLWDADTGRLQQELMTQQIGKFLEKQTPHPIIWSDIYLVPSLDYSDSHRIEMAPIYPPAHPKSGRNEVLFRWDIQTGKLSSITAPLGMPSMKTDAQGYIDRMDSYAVSSDGRWQLWGSTNEGINKINNLTLVDRFGEQNVQRFPVPIADRDENARYIAISADGRSILACYWALNRKNLPDASWIEVRSAATGKQLMSMKVNLPRQDGAISNDPIMAFSPDGRQIAAVVNNEPGVRLLEVVSGTERRMLKTSEMIRSVAWSTDGRLLAGGGNKGNLYLWDVSTGQVVRRFIGHRGEVLKLIFSRDNLRLASAGGVDTTALIWDLRGLSYPKARIAESVSADALWAALRRKEADKAWSAMYLLVQNSEMAIPLLRERLQPQLPPDSKRIAELLTQLDNDDFQTRQRSKEQLAKMGEQIESTLQETLAKKPSVEVQQSINRLLDEISGSATPSGLRPGQLRAYRAVEVLERIGKPAAIEALDEVVRLSPGSIEAEEAVAALQRLQKTKSVQTPN